VIANIPNRRLIILLSYRSKMKREFIIYNLYESPPSAADLFAAASTCADTMLAMRRYLNRCAVRAP
jgi:hypothetical protein